MNTSMPINDISIEVGFLSHSYFSKVFKRETGMRPSEIRINSSCFDEISANSGYESHNVLWKFIYKQGKAEIRYPFIISRVLSYVNKYYMQKITLKSISDFVSLNPSYFCRIFKESTGCRFSEFLSRFRIEKSKELLRDPLIRIIDVSGLVGFEEQSYFAKIFKNKTGKRPIDYKRSIS